MRCKFSILFFLFFISVNSQDSKKITEIFFYDFDIEIPTPAFDKKKGFTKYDEMIAFLDNIKANFPEKISIKYIGKSQKGKEIPMVFLGNQKSPLIKTCFMGGLHGNEPAGTEGMLLLINNLLKVDSIAKILDKVNLAIIPMANIDGYEKQSRYANNGQDLNRDHTKLTNPEMIAIKKAINNFSPDLMVDFHEYKP
ncbi:MAG: peptidase, partial [Crocinitomicaceae bacterium]|nr:peptidase [Crocinitomicaceae bacterium]